MNPVIVITRTQPDADALSARLEAAHFTPMLEPMLRVRATHAPTPHDPMCVEGLVVTSAHALRHLNALVREVALRHKPLYAVGQRTARLAQDMGWTNVHDGGGDVRRLGEFLDGRSEITPSSRLLHICGRDIARDTRSLLDRVRGRVLDWVVYEAEITRSFSPDFVRALKEKRVRAMMFHSARAAAVFGENVRAYVDTDEPDAFAGMICLCLSQAVLESLPSGMRAYTADTPDEDAMIALLREQVSKDGEMR